MYWHFIDYSDMNYLPRLEDTFHKLVPMEMINLNRKYYIKKLLELTTRCKTRAQNYD